MKIVFFGTSKFALPALEALIKNGYEIAAVITTPDEPADRRQLPTSPPVKITAEDFGLKVLQPKKLKDGGLSAYQLISLSASLGIIAAYGKIIPQEIIDLFPRGLLNIHPSLLPKYRGSSPIQSALLNGDEETGVTILKVDAEVDHGPILESRKWEIENGIKYEELENQLAKLGAELLIKILPDYLAGKLKPREQDHVRMTLTHRISKDDGRIDWRKPADQIYNQFRAFHQWPGIWTTWQSKILKITDCQISNGKIEILRLQLAGGKEMSLKEFFAGHKDFTESELE